MVISCSSKSKKEQSSQPETPESSGSGTAAQVEDQKPSTSAPVEPVAPKKEAALDPRYKQLSAALRSQSSSAGSTVQDEAAKILGVAPDDPVALNTLALLQLRSGRPGAAKLLLMRALDKNPPDAAGLRNNLGVALLKEGDRDGAVAQFKKALQIDDHNTEALGNLGSIYAEGGDYLKARPLLEASYKAYKGNPQVANNYAVALRASKDLEGARKVYDALLQSNSRDVNVLLNYAILLIDFMDKPKDGLDLVYKVKFLETQRKDVLSRANALEKKAKSELK